ncbi:expressed unknown protein [Seminavis robusta]|uniref:Uncharacterized protein n=1 Tax=Seminavis robusta TaxID=568900 RepID=A0A9N8HKX1_9STRA|nr:expressed unknown protein [Seminavis robusta]|eukprot:Sro783_g201900.1 n/a (236) ;mRNA; f:29774-30481
MMMNTSSNSDSDLTNQMELIQHACSLNNAGAAYMASNNGGQGVKFLKKALIIMEGISREEESDIIMAPSDGIAHFPFVEIPGLEEDEDTFYVYNRALVLDPPSDVSMTDLVFLNASILFNLALAFHQHGKVRCQEPMLRKAINLYDLAARLIEDLSSSYGALVVAALNNQAHIHRELCNFQDASQLLQQVHFLSGQVPEPPMEDSSSSAFTAALFDEIFLNITMAAQIPTTAASA